MSSVCRVIKPAPRALLVAGAAGLLVALALPLWSGASVAAAATAAATGDALTAAPTSLDLGDITVGDVSAVPDTVTLTNGGTSADTITSIAIGGADYNDFAQTNNCTTLAAGASCTVDVTFQPGALGLRRATLTPVDGSASPPVVTLEGTGSEGYYEVTAQGAVAAHGDANSLGGLTGTTLTRPIVASTTTGDDSGYWLAASDGGVFTFGDANYYGSTGAIHLNKPIVGIAPTLDDGGYWLVASDGGIFTFGDAPFYGSTGAIHLNKPIVGMAPTPDGRGYWLVASDGGVFSFGDAVYYGSTGAIHLNAPIVGMAATPDGGGYWLMASDGGIFAFGDAPFDGSSAGTSASPYVTIAGDGPPTYQAYVGEPAARRAADEVDRAR
jgi:hypothetical protein